MGNFSKDVGMEAMIVKVINQIKLLEFLLSITTWN
jgi:hypothetical protein